MYKRLLLEHREFLALNVYVALCYCKLDYYDVSLEILAVYLQQHLDSAVAVNLKACNLFKLYTGKAAEAELKVRYPPHLNKSASGAVTRLATTLRTLAQLYVKQGEKLSNAVQAALPRAPMGKILVSNPFCAAAQSSVWLSKQRLDAGAVMARSYHSAR